VVKPRAEFRVSVEYQIHRHVDATVLGSGKLDLARVRQVAIQCATAACA
jgi:hypothetical protein